MVDAVEPAGGNAASDTGRAQPELTKLVKPKHGVLFVGEVSQRPVERGRLEKRPC